MVGEQHDHRPLVDPQTPQLAQEVAHHRIGGGDLAVVGRGPVARGERFGRGIGGVWLVEMEEEEEGAAGGARPHPGQGRARAVGAGTLRLVAQVGGRRHAVVVEVEARGEAGGGGAEHRRRDHGAGVVARLLEEARQERVPGTVEGEPRVVAHPVHRRQLAGEQRDVRRQGHRVVAVGSLEQQGVAAQRVDGRRRHAAIAVGRQVIGAQRVDRDQHHRRTGVGGRRAAAAAGSGGRQDSQRRQRSQRC